MPKRRLHHDSGHRCRDDVPKQNPRRTGSERAGGLHELELASLQHLPPHQTRVADPTDYGERHDDVHETWPEHGDQRDRQQNAREREQHVDRPADHIVQPAAEISCNRPEKNTDERRDADYGQPDSERNSSPSKNARKNIAAKLVETERVIDAGPLEPKRQLLAGRIVGSHPGSRNGAENGDQHDGRADANHDRSTLMRGSRKPYVRSVIRLTPT